MRMVWFRPSMIDRSASGNCTFVRICHLRRARRTSGFDGLGRHLADPERGEPDTGRQRVDDGRDQTGHAPDIEQRDHRHEVDERRHHLRGVEEWPDDREESLTAARDDADRERDHHRDHDRDEHLTQRVHRVDPDAGACTPSACRPATMSSATAQIAATRRPAVAHASAVNPVTTIHHGRLTRNARIGFEQVDHGEVAQRARSADDRHAVAQVVVAPVDDMVRPGRAARS